ncbi:hypothetical protein ACFQ8C_21350 [Streptomyces sp. NPDC056503]|uniref:hypothetical protein n=1 Tax=Streptomyces sp. NPDC056503 TaxID=3345842 RepID=UPI00369AB100
MRFVRSRPARGRSRPARGSRVLAAGLLAAATLPLATAAPAAADVVEPFGPRYQESLYGDSTTVGNTVMGCPPAPAGPAARCATATRGEGADGGDAFVTRRPATGGTGDAYGTGGTGSGGSMADTGAHGERLWLLGALAVVLAATGLVAKAAMRGRRIR